MVSSAWFHVEPRAVCRGFSQTLVPVDSCAWLIGFPSASACFTCKYIAISRWENLMFLFIVLTLSLYIPIFALLWLCLSQML